MFPDRGLLGNQGVQILAEIELITDTRCETSFPKWSWVSVFPPAHAQEWLR